MLAPVSRVADFFCPLTQRILLVNQLAYPDLRQVISRQRLGISPSDTQRGALTASMLSVKDSLNVQTRIIESIHQSAHRIISQDPDARDGVMSSEEFMRVYELDSKLDIFHHRLLGCPKGFQRRVRMFPYFYQIKEGTAPFDALESFFAGPTVTDCGGTVEAVFMKAIADTVGEARFNALFSLPSMSLRLQSKGVFGSASLLPLFTQTLSSDFESKDVSHLKRGSRLYFQGVPWYLAKRPYGTGSGLHSICMNDPAQEKPLFWGIGLKQFSTQEQILEFLLRKYHIPRSDEERVLIDSIQGDLLNELFELHPHLAFHRKEVQECLDAPDRVLLLDDVRNKMGFLGYEHVDVLSPDVLALIQSTPPEELKTEKFLHRLAWIQTALTCQKVAEKRNRVMG